MSNNIEFQIVDWNVFNLDLNADSRGSDEEVSEETHHRESITDSREFVVQLYGRTAKGKSITVSVTGYTPFFFVKIPQTWSKAKVKHMEQWVRDMLPEQYSDCLVSCKRTHKYDFRGFSNYHQFKYARFVFTNTLAMRECVGLFQFKYFLKVTEYYYQRIIAKRLKDEVMKTDFHQTALNEISWQL